MLFFVIFANLIIYKCGQSLSADFVHLFLGALLAFAATAAGAALVLPIKDGRGGQFALLASFSGGVMALSAWEMLVQSHAASGD